MTTLHRIPLFRLTLCVALAAFIGGCGGQEASEDAAMSDTDAAMSDTVMMEEDAMMGHSLHAELAGANEVPGPGDGDGMGSAMVMLHASEGEVCYELSFEGIGEATGAHIHSGARGRRWPSGRGPEHPGKRALGLRRGRGGNHR